MENTSDKKKVNMFLHYLQYTLTQKIKGTGKFCKFFSNFCKTVIS